MIRSKKDPHSILKFLNWILNSGYTPIMLINSNNFKAILPKLHKFKGIISLLLTPSAVKDLKIGSKNLQFDTSFEGESFRVVIPHESLIDIKSRENSKISLYDLYANCDAIIEKIMDYRNNTLSTDSSKNNIELYSNQIIFLKRKLQNCKNYLMIYTKFISYFNGNKFSDYLLQSISVSTADIDNEIVKYKNIGFRLDLLKIKLTDNNHSNYTEKLLHLNEAAKNLTEEIISEYKNYREYIEKKINITMFELRYKYLSNRTSKYSEPNIDEIICGYKVILDLLQNVYWQENAKNFIFQIEYMKNSFIYLLIGNSGEIREANLLLNEIENRIATLSQTA